MREFWKQHLGAVLLLIALFCLAAAWWLHTTPWVRFRSLKPVDGMNEAGIYYYSETAQPRAIVLLANMYNTTRHTWIDDPEWRRFARDQQCALVELAFSSPENKLIDGTGYYYASRGSGALLLNSLDDLWPEQPPLLLYGFSGGAHFVSRFAAWTPGRVKGWVAYSAGWWDEPTRAPIEPPGVVVCGELDSRWQASSKFYRAGVGLGKPWLWIGVAGNEHVVDPRISTWVSGYFAGLLANADGKWVESPGLRGWLAVTALETEWRNLNQIAPYVESESVADDENL